jgi:NADPH:quinone reductase-like Zn-dependent oxidoreductase
MLLNYIYTREEFEDYANELFRFIEREKPNIKIHEVYPLQDVARAHTVSAIDISITYNYMLHCPTGAIPRE